MDKQNDILKYYKEELKWNPPFADIFSSYAPEALDGYLQMRECVQNGKLSPKTRELIFTILDTLDGELEGAKAHAKKAITAAEEHYKTRSRFVGEYENRISYRLNNSK